jgi:hypothetical protein
LLKLYHHSPKYYLVRQTVVVRCLCLLFMLLLAGSLVSLPFASKINKITILNTVEEENTGFSTEQGDVGKNYPLNTTGFELPVPCGGQTKKHLVIGSVAIVPTNHTEKDIQPPDGFTMC